MVARWDAPNGHGSWVDVHGDIYLATNFSRTVDKYVRQA